MRFFPFALAGLSFFVLTKAFGRSASAPSKPRCVPGTKLAARAIDPTEVDALTRMLWAETSFFKTPEELIGILYVATNREKKYGRSIIDVVKPPGRPTWNNHSSYFTRYAQAPSKVTPEVWAAHENLVRRFLSGEFKNCVGDRVQFVHPERMPKCGGPCGPTQRKKSGACVECSGKCVETSHGVRCLPTWSLDTYASVLTIGDTRFS